MVGNLVDFSFDKRGNLVVTLLDEGREAVEEMREDDRLTDNDIFVELTEYYWCNGWDRIRPGDLALFDDYRIAFAQDRIEDDYGNLLDLGSVYTYDNYQIDSEVDAMLRDGYVVLTKYK